MSTQRQRQFYMGMAYAFGLLNVAGAMMCTLANKACHNDMPFTTEQNVIRMLLV